MKNITSILLIFTMVRIPSHGQSFTPVETHGSLKIVKNTLVDQNGIPPQLRGVSLSWSLWQGKKYYNPSVVDWLASDFHVSIIRASMGVQPEHGYLQEPALQTKLMTGVIDQAIKNGVYVLIDWHDHHSNMHVKEAKQFFTYMAKKYAGVPNVIYEIWNEPEAISWDTVKAYALDIIPDIRKYDRKNIIVVGSPHWDQDVDIAASDPITGFNNIAYSFHFYASDPNHQQKLRDRADYALKKKLPLIITEWGVGESDGNGKFNTDEVKIWFDWMEANKLSWTNWNLTDKQETTALLLPGAAETGSWNINELSPAGKYIKHKLVDLNK